MLKRGPIKKLPIEAAKDPDALLEIDNVEMLCGIRRASILARVKDQTFPQPIRIGPRCRRWRAGAVREWLLAQGA